VLGVGFRAVGIWFDMDTGWGKLALYWH
jgi:hypothetical protein